MRRTSELTVVGVVRDPLSLRRGSGGPKTHGAGRGTTAVRFDGPTSSLSAIFTDRPREPM